MKRNVLITGCSSGIGYFCAKELMKDENYKVFATARKDEDIERLKSEGFEVLKLDLSNKESIHKCAKEILKLTDNNLYALFNNAAYGQPGAVEDLTIEVLREQFETNLFGTHELTRLLIPSMRKKEKGRIIQNSSILGFVAFRFRGAYNASKFALEGLSDTLRMELYGSGIYVSLIEPGPIRSDFRKNALEKFLKNIDREKSFFKMEYEKKLEALKSDKEPPFTLQADAVYEVFKEILDSPKPKARYRVTTPTKLFWFLKKILSDSMLDKILMKIE
ncbi:MAG: SDR family NAD(P)-dependent oxidoreductase [Epsilonproteobacteria bacterium]|nr:SDR family NAD(P)-dependent oxidoreductase [Campylobacterota bacterium]